MSDRSVEISPYRRSIAAWLCACLVLVGIAMPWSAAAADCPYSDYLALGPSESTIEGSDVWRACASITLESGYTVGPAGQVLLEAGERVTLRPGARVQLGSTLRVSVWGDRGPPLANVSLIRSGPGVFWVTLPDGQERYCGTGCEKLELVVPAGTALIVDPLPESGTVLWSWGSLPCSTSSSQCEVTVNADLASLVVFAEATTNVATFDVPAGEASTHIDPDSGVRLSIPSGVVVRPTSIRLNVQTNSRGERNYSIEILNPDDWHGDWIDIEIEPDGAAAPMDLETQGMEPLLGEDPVPSSPFILPERTDATFMKYDVDIGGGAWSAQENRVTQSCIASCEKHWDGSCKPVIECNDKEIGFATARCGEPGVAAVCEAGRWPVVLVHGFRSKDGYLSDGQLTAENDVYWRDLPSLLYSAGYAPYVFRWNTAQRFEDAASLLREIATQVRGRHENRAPLIVAHSFGGLVARVYAQGLDRPQAAVPGPSDLLGVVTIGTPHSGIFKGATSAYGVQFPSGVDPSGKQTLGASSDWVTDRCLQISCYQAGRDVNIFIPRKRKGMPLMKQRFGVSNLGETIFGIGFQGRPMKVPLMAYLGLQIENGVLKGGDGLISWQGQRVHPRLSCSNANQSCADRSVSNWYELALQEELRLLSFDAHMSEHVLGSHGGAYSLLTPGVTVAHDFTGYAHGHATQTSSGEEKQNAIEENEHANPDRHDVLIAIKRILSVVSHAPLNDTGITWSGHATSGNAAFCNPTHPAGQDCHYGRDALAAAGMLTKVGGGSAGFDFTKIANNGGDLPASATLGSGPNDWACTGDNVTGLIWEVKVNNSAHVRHWSHTYTWYDPSSPDGNQGTENGGTCTGSACDASGFVQAVNVQGLCGSSGWRMPTRRELHGIVDYGRQSPAIDTGYFPNTSSSGFWSGSPGAYYSSLAWVVGFNVGGALYGDRGNNLLRVRLVRGGQ